MPVLSRPALEASPLADLHALAAELGIDGFRRLRKADLVGAIIERQGGEDDGVAEVPSAEDGAPLDAVAPEAADAEADAEADEDVDEDVKAEAQAAVDADVDADADVAAAEEEPVRPRRRRSRSRATSAATEEEGTTDEDADGAPEAQAEEDEDRSGRARRPRRTTRGRRRTARDRDDEALADDSEPEAAPAATAATATPAAEEAEERELEGVVELLGNGSGFLRVDGDGDVYVSAAQIRRCELVDGDRVRGPVRPPRRSERHPSLVRVDTINGRAADEVSEGTPFDELPAAFPTERLDLGDGDVTLKAIGWLTPLGRGSRVTVVGPSQAGKSEALRRMARALAQQDGVEVLVVLAGVRPEELGEWRELGVEAQATLTFAASADARLGAIERAVETAKRLTARGGHAVLLVDGLEGLPAQGARKALAAARNVVDGGSLTIIATAPAPVGGETTVVALDRALTAVRRFPALDLVASGTLRAELLVGEAGADAIAQARAAGVRHA